MLEDVIITSNIRRATLDCDNETVSWVGEWWYPAFITHPPDVIKKNVDEEMAIVSR